MKKLMTAFIAISLVSVLLLIAINRLNAVQEFRGASSDRSTKN